MYIFFVKSCYVQTSNVVLNKQIVKAEESLASFRDLIVLKKLVLRTFEIAKLM